MKCRGKIVNAFSEAWLPEARGPSVKYKAFTEGLISETRAYNEQHGYSDMIVNSGQYFAAIPKALLAAAERRLGQDVECEVWRDEAGRYFVTSLHPV